MYKATNTTRIWSDIPIEPHCRQEVDPKDPPEVQKAETTWPTNGREFTSANRRDQRRSALSLYNLNQVLEVLEENIPLRPGETLAQRPHAGGLRILRDIFYELYFSTRLGTELQTQAGRRRAKQSEGGR